MGTEGNCRGRALALLLWMFSFFSVPFIHAQVRVWEGTVQLASSDEAAPDENPPFNAFSELENYPYTMRQIIRGTETMHTWRAILLENEYLKCTILPDVGGHIYTCIDKINGKPMFYANPSLKKAPFAYRGAWAAFGEEFNFPVSHNWVSISPVDFAFSIAADGSASVTVGNRDRVYGMDWVVEILLRPGSALLEEHVTLSNHSDLRHHYFWWNNGAVQVWDDSRFWYPMHLTTDMEPWPVDSKGVDQSLISNETAGQVERFSYDTREPFIGVYNPHIDAGTVHYAEYNEVPAKKVWSWGVDKIDLETRHTLSDNVSAYVELQSGLFKDQSTFAYLEPRQAVHFSEFWMPVRGIGSISRANLAGVVGISREKQANGKIALKIGFNANHAVPGAKIKILDGADSLFAEDAVLTPATTWTHQISDLPADKKYTFLLTDGNGGALLNHTEDSYDLIPRDQLKPPTATPVPAQKDWSAADFVNDGATRELGGDRVAAWESYRSGLAKFPASLELQKAAGRLAVSEFRFEEAISYLGQAEEHSGSDAEIHYYRGVAEKALGNEIDARKEFEAARNTLDFRAAAGLLLAESLALGHDSAGALKELEQSCPAKLGDLRCVEEMVALLRSSGAKDRARSVAAAALREYPTSAFLQNELGKLGSPTPDLDRHLAADTSRILNLVIQYNRLGLYSDSLELLTRSYPGVPPEQAEPNALTPANDAQLGYYRGFCKERLGQSGQADFESASHLPLLYVFPNEADTFPVLHAALAANPSDASAHFLLGALWMSKQIVDPAMEEWKLAESLNPKIPSLQASLGRALLYIKKQPADAAAVFQRGLLVDAANPALYMGLNEAMLQTGKTPAQRAQMLKAFPTPADMPTPMVWALVNALRDSGRIEEANSVQNQHFPPPK